MDQILEHLPRRRLSNCPYCKSYYIQDNFCESCGRKLVTDFIGPPLGPKSFYSLKEDHLMLGPWYFKLFPVLKMILGRIDSHYVFSLKKRFETLVQFFSATTDEDRSNEKKAFKIELRDLSEELLKLKVPYFYFVNQLEDQLTRSWAKNLLIWIQDSYHQTQDQNLFDRLLEYRVMGTFRFPFLVVLTLGLLGLSSFAIGVFSNFLK